MPRQIALATLALLAACAPETDGGRPAEEKAAATWVLDCPDLGRVVVREVPGKAWLFLPAETRNLPQAEAASGVRYSDGTWTAWTKGRDVMILNGEDKLNCTGNPQAAVWEHAKLNGVDFRAVGQEPGWLLEISDKERLHLEADYGALVIDTLLPPLAHTPDGTTARYRIETDEHTISIDLAAGPCTDTMSGESFETSVTLTLDGRTLKGCGRPLH